MNSLVLAAVGGAGRAIMPGAGARRHQRHSVAGTRLKRGIVAQTGNGEWLRDTVRQERLRLQ